MSIISFVLLAILGLAMATISVFFVLIIKKNRQQGRIYRRELAHNAKEVRMSKLVNALGHDFNVYLHQVPVLNIKQSMAKCQNCDTTSSCDEKLNQTTLNASEISFCPIHDSLVELTESSRQAA
jgi:hypothetical protein